jgi:hypothetical protein
VTNWVTVNLAMQAVSGGTSAVSTVPSEYWLAVATTAPVLALALVLEARAIVRGWTTSTQRLYRTILSVLWAAPLLGFVVTEYYALRALHGEVAPSWLPRISELAISGAMLILVLVPTVDFFFVRAQAELLARVLAVKPVSGLKGWRLRLKLARDTRRVKKTIDDSRKMFDQSTDKLNEQSALLAVAERVGIKDLESLRAEIDTKRLRQREQREELERLVAQRTTYYEDYRRKQSELQNINRSLSRIQKEATAERLLPGPNSTARLTVLAEEIRQLSEALTKVTDSANEITEQPAEPNND